MKFAIVALLSVVMMLGGCSKDESNNAAPSKAAPGRTVTTKPAATPTPEPTSMPTPEPTSMPASMPM